MELLLLLLLLLPSSSTLLPSFPVLGFDGSPGMDLLWFLSPSLPSLRRTGCLPFFATSNWHFFFLVAYFTDLVTAVMHGGRGKGPTTEGGRKGPANTRTVYGYLVLVLVLLCSRRSADLLPPPLKSR
jgi:hypothetical protein